MIRHVQNWRRLSTCPYCKALMKTIARNNGTRDVYSTDGGVTWKEGRPVCVEREGKGRWA